MKKPLLVSLALYLFAASLFSAVTYTPESPLVVSATVMNVEEIWDRRTNELMGRPDWLKEIILQIRVTGVVKGSSPESKLVVSIKGGKLLIQAKTIFTGQSGLFTLSGSEPVYSLVAFVPGPEKRPTAVTKPLPVNTPVKLKPLPFPENVTGHDIVKSKELQSKAVKTIAAKYKMTNASFITVTSFQGPMPPPGGYVYWGVKGQVKGKWFVWMPGRNGYLLEGQELFDEKMHQK